MKLNAGFTGASFFDAPKVIRAVTKTEHRVLSRFGAIVRRRAKTSIGKRKATSDPGDPPSSHTGWLKRMIFFGFDLRTRSVVVGPQLYGRGNADALEFGGDAKRWEKRWEGGKWRQMYGNRSLRPGEEMRVRKFKIAARPFMGPAFQDALPELPAMWRNSIR